MPLTRAQIADRLRAAREAIGFTQAEVAERMGMHRPTLSEIEAGRRAVTSEELAQLARIYATSVGALLAVTEPDEDEVVAVLFRRHGIDAPVGRLAVRRAQQLCLAERELEDLLGLPPVTAIRRPITVAPPTTTWEAIQHGESLATQERQRLNLGAEPIRNPLDLLERQGVRTVQLDDEDALDVDGIYFESGATGACVAVNVRREDWTGFRASFTAAHEYAHWLLNDISAEAFTLGGQPDDLIEVRANAFAAALLMPELGLRDYARRNGLLTNDGQIDHLSAADIVRAMDYFGVSGIALLYRLENLKLMSRDRANELRNTPRNLLLVAKALDITLRQDDTAPSRRQALAIEAWRRGLVSTGRAAELLGKEPGEFRATMEAVGEYQEMDDRSLLGAAGG